MAAPTSPKKRALMPSTKLRKALRAAGHHLSPVVQVGKEGVTAAVLEQLDQQLGAHELVKVKVGSESPEDRFEAAGRLGDAIGAQIAQILGRTVLVYRKHPEQPRFEAPDAKTLATRAASAQAAAAKAARTPRRGRGGGAGGRAGGRTGERGGRA